MKLQTIFALLASLLVATSATTIADVLADIATQSTQLDHAITAFSTKSGLRTALDIGKSLFSLISAIDKGTSTVKGVPKPLSEVDANNVLTEAQSFEPAVLQALSAVVSKKSDFVALPIPGVSAFVKKNLIKLNASASYFEEAVIASVPADLLSKTKSIKASIDDALARAIAAYS